MSLITLHKIESKLVNWAQKNPERSNEILKNYGDETWRIE